MVRRKKIIQKSGSKSSPIVSSTRKDFLDRVEDEDVVRGDPLEEVSADTVDVFQEVGEDHSLVNCDQVKSGNISGSGSWAKEAEEKDFQELAKEKWSKLQDSFAAQGGARLNYEEPLLQEGFINRIWGKLGIERIARMNEGYTLVKFRDEATRDMVLEAGVVHFDRKPVLLRPWSTNLDKLRMVKSVPVWVRLPDLGLQYWGLKTLSALVSTIGKPMMMDKVTKDKSMVKFARVLVDVEISDRIPHCVNFINECGQLMEQAINCKHAQEVHWKPKQKVTKSDKGDPGESADLGEPVLEERSMDPHLLIAEKVVQKNGKSDQVAIIGELKAERTLAKETSCSSIGQEILWRTRKWFQRGVYKKFRNLMEGCNLLFRNIRGLNGRNKQRSLLDFCTVNKIGFGGFLETKLKNNKVEEMMKNFFLGWHWYNSGSVEGRILLVWKDDIVQVNVIQDMDQLIHCEVKIKGVVQKAYLSIVYGRNSIEERKELCSQLTLPQASVEPWLVVGDFNVIFEFDDRIGGRMKAESRIFSKLNRIFINELWLDFFPESEARVNWDTISDHCYCIIKTVQFKESRIKPFRFYNLWANHKDFRSTVLDSWSKPTGGFQHYTAAKQRYERAQLLLQQSPYSCFLGKNSSVTGRVDLNCFQQGNVLSLEQQLDLTQPFTKKDVKRALFSIPSIKSPGPDGFGSGFFKALWNDIGVEISDAILMFFEHGEIPSELNGTFLTLIPKLAKILPRIIHQNQGAFIKNRQLAHNILILQDLLHGYTRKNISPRCLIKIDLSKAYDSIDWAFLEEIMTAFCFPRRFIKWIMIFLKGTSYTLLLNGRLQGSFEGRKGLRQGDPISPLLFVLVMEYLTRPLKQVFNHREFRFHPMCKHLHLVNICFADDLILFCKGNFRSVQLLFKGILSFCNSSGLTANLNKSQLFFGEVATEVKINILNYVALGEGRFPSKYLGVSLRPTRWLVADCGEIIKKIQARLHVWASRHLSFAGRTQLIFSVLLSIRNYWMHIFMLPSSVIQEIDRLCRKFLWGSTNNRSKFPCTSWFQWIDAIYLKGQSFWSYHLKPDVSWYWRKLCYLREIFLEAVLVDSAVNGKLKLKVLLSSILQRDNVDYAKAVWCSLSVPKHRFILWQSVLGHLLTRDNLMKCQISFISLLCPVCKREEESHLHLFFDCIFSRQVWQLLKDWLGPGIWPNQFAGWKEWLKGKPKNILHCISVASLAAAVYSIWCNRNSCIFSHCSFSPFT
ncbi:uncharacterized protein LOC133824560 [Humulus lupulus]|uniref:uncharacterized protein LOC133824560 n=1 Tax=Humulus lupulus TaxID=3486 RepID=UPI002B409BAD|nr:uncharacterized protein LOC133824560 [Humulus lupulus]